MTIPMRFIATATLILAAAAYFSASVPAAARWCATYTSGASNCGFSTQQQCLDTVRGVGGSCSGSDDASPAPRRAEKRKAVQSKPKEKEKPKPAAVEPPPAPAAKAPPPGQGAPSFQSAKALILSDQYQAGIAAMRALGYDDHPDIASMIGYANAKLGHLDEARSWFQRALAADPNHLSTLFSSGALYLMRGDAGKARGELARIKSVCGAASCPEYRQLESLIAAKAR